MSLYEAMNFIDRFKKILTSEYVDQDTEATIQRVSEIEEMQELDAPQKFKKFGPKVCDLI